LEVEAVGQVEVQVLTRQEAALAAEAQEILVKESSRHHF
jgi:hypothetical protein